MSNDEKKPNATKIPLSDLPESLKDAISKAKPVGGANPLDRVTVQCTNGKKAHVVTYKDKDGNDVTVVVCK